MNWIKFIGWNASLILGLTIVAFFLTHLAPGDPARIVLGPNANEAAVADLRLKMGLARPVFFQFASYSARLMTGQWGDSWLARRPVLTELFAHLPPTLCIGFVAISFAVVAALLLNALVFAAPRLRLLISVFRTGVAAPGIIVALFAALAVSRIAAVSSEDSLLAFVAPGIAAAVYTACLMSTLLHDRFTEIRQSSAFRAMRAFGFSKSDLFLRALLPNSRSLLLTLVTNQLGLIFFSTIIAEQIFSIQGIGALLVRSIQGKDLPMIAALILCNGFFFLGLQALGKAFGGDSERSSASSDLQEVVA